MNADQIEIEGFSRAFAHGSAGAARASAQCPLRPARALPRVHGGFVGRRIDRCRRRESHGRGKRAFLPDASAGGRESRGAHPQPGADQPRATGGRDVFHRRALRAFAGHFTHAREGHRLRRRCGNDHRGGFVSGSGDGRGAREGGGLQRADPLWRQCDHPHRRGVLARDAAGDAPRAGGGNAGSLAGKSLPTRRTRAFPPGGRNHRRQHDDAPHPRRRGSDFAGDRSVHRAFSRRASPAIRRHRTRDRECLSISCPVYPPTSARTSPPESTPPA